MNSRTTAKTNKANTANNNNREEFPLIGFGKQTQKGDLLVTISKPEHYDNLTKAAIGSSFLIRATSKEDQYGNTIYTAKLLPPREDNKNKPKAKSASNVSPEDVEY